MENQLITTDYRFSLSASSICLTEVKEWTGIDRSKKRTKQNENLNNNATKGILSPKNIKRIKKAVDWLIVSSQDKVAYSMKANTKFKFKVNFVTLTIPPQENGNVDEISFKQMLNTWLTYHRKYNDLNNYVWKIEAHKDGRLHIHITTDSFIHWKSVNDTWNQILRRNGLLELHYKKYGNYTPPSAEVRSVKKIKKIGAYIAKYMAKNNQENPMFRGRVWGCSLKISKVLANVCYVCPTKIWEATKPIFDADIKTIVIETEPNVFGQKYKVADIYLMKIKDWIKIKGSFLYEVFKEIIIFLREAKPQDVQLRFDLA